MTVTFTGDVAFKQKLFEVIKNNELGSSSPYQLNFADPNSQSGWSFGWNQMDLAVNGNTRARATLQAILANATDLNGNRIVSNPAIASTLFSKAKIKSSTSLTPAERQLIGSTLLSSYGQAAIDATVDLEFSDLIVLANTTIALASPSNQIFLNSDLGKIFIIDYANQYGISPGQQFETFVAGGIVQGVGGPVQIDGPMGIDDLLNFYFHLAYPWKNSTDPLRRFSNIVAETGYTPSDAAEAENLFRVATYFIQPNIAKINSTTGGPQVLNTFVAAVLEPARQIFIDSLATEYSVQSSLFSAIQSPLSILADPVLSGMNSNNNATLDARAYNSSGVEVAQDNVLVGRGGVDTLEAGLGNDILIGGMGTDHLRGGIGNDVYLFRNGDGVDTIEGNDDEGSIRINGVLIGAAAVQVGRNAWEEQVGGQTIRYELISGSAASTGTLRITWEGSQPDDRVDIQDFSVPNDDLGINLPVNPALAILADANGAANPWWDYGFTPSTQTADLIEARSRTITLAFNTALSDTAATTIRFSVDALEDVLYLVNGAETLAFENGEVEVTLAPGQTTATFSLVTQGDVDASDTVNLTATVLDALGDPTGITADLIVNYLAINEAASANSVFGDVGGAKSDVLYGQTSGSNTMAGGSLGDIVLGQDYGDILFGESVVDVQTAISSGATGAGTPGLLSLSAASGSEFLSSGAGNDTLVGGITADMLAGGEGDDLLVGGAGDDYLVSDDHFYGIGVDDPPDWTLTESIVSGGRVFTMTGDGLQGPFRVGSGSDVIHAGGGDDVAFAGAGNDQVYGEEGDDAINGGLGDDTLLGGDGNDSIGGDADLAGYAAIETHGNDFIDGGAGNDTLDGEGGEDTIYGGSGNDVIRGDFLDTNAGTDYLNGEDGDDLIYGGGGADTLIGGAGNDGLYGELPTNATAVQADDSLDGGAGEDTLVGGGGNDTLIGGVDDDDLFGDYEDTPEERLGRDYLDGGAGNDTLVGGGEADTLIGGDGNDSIYGEYGNTTQGLEGDDYIDGGAGDDQLLGVGGNDTILGGDGADLIWGDAGGGPVEAEGDDYLDGGAGNDTIFGNSGNDLIIGGAGEDYLVGDNSSDVAGVDRISGGDHNDTIYGGGGDDHLSGDAGNDTLSGGSGGSVPNSGNDYLVGGDGDDYLFGQDGNDHLSGNAGHDVLYGHEGDDVLETDGGNDTLVGGAGNDTYVLNGAVGAVSISDTEGTNALSLSDASLMSVFFSGGNVSLQLSSTDYISMSFDTFRTFGITLSDGTSLTQEDLVHEIIPGNSLDPNIWLYEGVALPEITVHAFGDDLVLAYSGTIEDWFAPQLMPTSVPFYMDTGIAYGLDSDDSVLVIPNWYLGNQTYALTQLRDSNGTTYNFLGDAQSALRIRMGTMEGDYLGEFSSNDALIGFAGDDVIVGGDGNDTIEGGEDDDVLIGGENDDTYLYRIGDGNDIVQDEGGNDAVVFGLGIAPEDLAITEVANGLNVQVGLSGAGDSIFIADWASGSESSIDRFEFAGGLSLNRDEIDALNTGNHSPRVSGFVDDQLARIDQAFSFVLPEDLFSDLDDNMTSLAVTQEDGTPLPAWLNFDVQTQTFYGTPLSGDAGTISIRVDVADAGGLSNHVGFQINAFSTIDVMGSENADEIFPSGSGNYAVWGLGGNDNIATGPGFDYLYGGIGNDTLAGEGGADTLVGGVGDDGLYGGTGNDLLIAGFGNDILDGDEGSDTMEGGAGDDYYYVDSAQDTVKELLGQGIDTVYAGISTYVLGENLENLELTGAASLIQGVGNELNNSIRAAYFSNSTLMGMGGDDILIGLYADDILLGGDGNDTLRDDRGGNNIFEGGLGDDYYQLNSSYGDIQIIIDIGGFDFAAFGEELDDPGVTVERDGNDLVVTIDDFYDNTFTFQDWYLGPDRRIEQIRFGEQTYSADQIESYVLGINSAPYNATPLPDLMQYVGTPIQTYRIGYITYPNPGVFSDTQSDITYSFQLTGGGALPSWLNVGFDSSSIVVTGTTAPAVPGVWSIDIVGTDASNISTTETFLFSVAGTSETLLGTSSVDYMEGTADDNTIYGYALWDVISARGGNDYIDGGAGDDVMYGGLGDDTYIFDSVDDIAIEGEDEGHDRMFSSSSAILDEDVEDLTLTGPLAVDGFGNSSSNILIGNGSANVLTGYAGDDVLDGGDGDDALIGGEANDSYIGFDLTSGHDEVFDSQGNDRLVLSVGSGQTIDDLSFTRSANDLIIGVSGQASITLISWFSGSSYQIESLSVVSDDVEFLYTNVQVNQHADQGNAVPIAPEPLEQQSGRVLESFSYQVPFHAFTDIESQTTLSYSVSEILGQPFPTWLTFDAMTRTFTGTPSVSESGHYYVRITVTDEGGLTASAEQHIFVAPPLIQGTVNDDQITGSNLPEEIWGLGGEDIIDALDGDDLLSGGDGNDVLYAGAGNDSLTGGDGNDLLDGGVGQDEMYGGTGNDIYLFDNAYDSVTEYAGDGVDEIRSDVYIDLSNFEAVENLTLTGIGSVNADGNDLGNVIVGNASGNTIYGFDGDDALYGDGGIDTLNGGYGNDILDGGVGNDVMEGRAGNDIYYVDSTSDSAAEFSVLGIPQGTDLVRSTVNWTLGDYIENLELLGTANINGTGNSWDNQLTGNSGNNVFNGGSGSDTMRGGLGNDTYVVSSILDVVVELSGEGTDTVQTTSEYTLDDHVENLTLTGSSSVNGIGNSLNNVLTGNSGTNTLTGYEGNDTLNGGSGSDTMIGGEGNDIYVVGQAGDVVTELAGEGADTVQASITYILGAELENLTLTGSSALNGTGNAVGNVLIGNSGSNTLAGLGDNDTLDAGSAGTDVLQGGQGDDTYIIGRTSGITVTENVSEGTDTVQASVTHTLANNVENLVLTGSSAINGTGNTLANTLTGNSNNNTLSGGTGADTMIGGLGNDTYVVDNASDVTTEAVGEGTDLVQSSVTHTLASNVENLTLTGSSALNGTGNGLDNALTGNSGSNTLTGGDGNDTLNPGTAGTDVLIGGLGNDTYIVGRTSGITVTESTGEGIDTVQASVTYTLGNNVENLTLTGSSNLNGTGNTLDNVLIGTSGTNTLTGNAGNDTLDGGTGTDTMVGGQGDDVYYVNVSGDVTTESAGQGTDSVNSSVTRTLAANIELLFLTGTSAINGTGNTLANLLRGNTGINTLAGGGGTDILEGGDGNDILSNTSGNTLLNGGIGTDTLTGTSNNDLLIGGAGNDSLTTGSGADVLAFNVGHGQDTVAVSTTQDNTVSLGGIAYADLLFQKSGNNLILLTGGGNQITFTNYYASASNRSVDILQVVIENTTDYIPASGDAMNNQKIQTFDFDDLVTAFDAALVINPGLSSWALTNALLTEHLGGSDTAACGGDLGYRYGLTGSLSDISFTPAVGILGAAGFGSTAQTLQSLASLQDSTARLQ